MRWMWPPVSGSRNSAARESRMMRSRSRSMIARVATFTSSERCAARSRSRFCAWRSCSRLRRRSLISVESTGLVRKSVAPISSARRRTTLWPAAVTITTGTSASSGVARAPSMNWWPSITGIMKSTMIRSAPFSRHQASARTGSSKRTGSWPVAERASAAISIRLTALSSMMTMFMPCLLLEMREQPFEGQRERHLHHRKRQQHADQADAERDRKADRGHVHLLRTARNDAEHQVDEQQHRHQRQRDPQPQAKNLGTPYLRLYRAQEREWFRPDGKGVKTLHKCRDQHQVAVDDDEQPAHRDAEEAADGGGF